MLVKYVGSKFLVEMIALNPSDLEVGFSSPVVLAQSC
jgi:hypothetical protein